MKVTKETLDNVNYIERDIFMSLLDAKKLLSSLIDDVNELNQLLVDKCESYRQLYIDWQDVHNEYSAERTDPCPDYYGYFTLRFEKNPYESVGEPMTLEQLDNAILILTNFVEFKLS